ncbi:MAG: hypothetical protein HRU23_19130 [Gammaproteobacteria bacterium]|nr:hypothetical protein [Gammaproteobacteria bacterium]
MSKYKSDKKVGNESRRDINEDSRVTTERGKSIYTNDSALESNTISSHFARPKQPDNGGSGNDNK